MACVVMFDFRLSVLQIVVMLWTSGWRWTQKTKLTTSAAVGGVATPLRTCQTSSPLLLMSSFGSSVATGVSGGSAAGDVSLNDVSVHLAQGVDLEHIYELDALDTALDLAYTDVEVRNEGYQGLPVSLFFPPFCRWRNILCSPLPLWPRTRRHGTGNIGNGCAIKKRSAFSCGRHVPDRGVGKRMPVYLFILSHVCM